jgi:deoxyhypusine synthase
MLQHNPAGVVLKHNLQRSRLGDRLADQDQQGVRIVGLAHEVVAARSPAAPDDVRPLHAAEHDHGSAARLRRIDQLLADGEAVDVWEAMLKEKELTIVMGFAGSMSTAGQWKIVNWFIENRYIDVLVSTGANMTHDIIEAIGCHHYHGRADCSDIELRHEDINRIYDVYLPNEAFIRFEEFMQGIYSEIPEDDTTSISSLLNRIGSRLDSGILASAQKNRIPVYCPAIQDSMIGLQFWLFSQSHRVTVDAFMDMPSLLDRCFTAKKAGALLVGGGVPKNYILQSMLMTENGFSYAVQLTGDRPDLGGLSGATLDEARSWGKITEEAQAVTVYGDSTITLPLLVAAVMGRIHHG